MATTERSLGFTGLIILGGILAIMLRAGSADNLHQKKLI